MDTGYKDIRWYNGEQNKSILEYSNSANGGTNIPHFTNQFNPS